MYIYNMCAAQYGIDLIPSESLLVMSSLGVQLTTTFATGRTKSTFFDITEVKDIIINEAVTMVRETGFDIL